jgi:hypothetical protein
MRADMNDRTQAMKKRTANARKTRARNARTMMASIQRAIDRDDRREDRSGAEVTKEMPREGY